MILFLLASAALVAPEDLTSAIAAYDRAQVHGDRAELNQLLADDYLLVNSRGVVETKAQLIADYTAPGFTLEPFIVIQPVERVWNSGAVEGGIAMLRGIDDGKRYEVTLRFTDVWAKRSRRWQVVYTQVASVVTAK